MVAFDDLLNEDHALDAIVAHLLYERGKLREWEIGPLAGKQSNGPGHGDFGGWHAAASGQRRFWGDDANDYFTPIKCLSV